MVQGDVSPTGSYIWYVDEDGKGHNIPLQGDVNGNLKISGIGSIQADYDETNPPGDSILTISKIEEEVLQNAATTTGNGETFDIGAYKGLGVTISGLNVSTSTIIFEICDLDNNWTAIMGVRLSDLNVASSTNTVQPMAGEKWKFDVETCIGFRARISVLTGTNASLTIKARGVS